MGEILVAQLRHGMGDGAEIVDQCIAVQAERFRDRGWPDHPGIVGELEHLALDRARDRDPGGAREGAAEPGPELVPGGLQASMVGRLQGHRLVEVSRPGRPDLGEVAKRAWVPPISIATISGIGLSMGRFRGAVQQRQILARQPAANDSSQRA